MKYLITGGAGFIGSHLAETLLNLGHEVLVIDDLSTGSLNNITHLKKHNRFHIHIDSIFNKTLLTKSIADCDVVFHLAAAVGVRLIIEKPVHTIETNISGTESVLRLASEHKKLVLLASSSEVYGKGTQVPFREEDDMLLGATTKSRWSYACSKAIDEFLGLAYWHEKKTPVIIARLFNTVGPRQTGRYGMVVPRFVQQALAGGPITIYGDGKQSRCFGCVTDVIDGLIKLVNCPTSIGEVFNVGNTEEITIEGLAQKVRAKIAPQAAIKYIPYAEAYQEGFEDMHRRVPDITKIQKYIDYHPRFNIDNILDAVIEYERNHVN
jgi:UDP-glucose 4-epimerase